MLSIRTAHHNDIPALTDLNALVQDWHASHYPDRFRRSVDASALAAFFQQMIEGELTFVTLAVQNDQAIGYIFSRLNVQDGSPFTLPTRFLHIEHIAVAASHQRQGVAAALIQSEENRARALECHEINLTSWAQNQIAHAAFEALGFETRRHWFAKTL